MGLLRLLGSTVCLVGLALPLGCGNDPRTEATFTIRLDVDDEDFRCPSAECGAYAMTCGALVSLRVTDALTGELLLSDNAQPLSLCLEAPVSDTMCALRDINMQLFGIPPQNVRVEVALFNPDDVVTKGVCPDPKGFELFDAYGRPQSNANPAPALAGSVYFRAGDVSEVNVPLLCPRAELLSVDTCTANLPTDVRAVVTDIESMQTVRKEQAPSIAVTVGEARSVIDNEGASFFTLEAADTFPLVLDNSGAIPVYENDAVDGRFGTLVCSTTLEGQPQATITANCQEVPKQAPALELQSVLIRKNVVDAALAALGETAFPDGGIVIGRVVDESFSPSAGVSVTPQAGSVLYLDDDLSVSAVGLTSNSAYFVATDVPFGSTWTASHFNDGRRQSGSPRGGLIRGKVSSVIIRMTGDVIGE